VIQIAAGDLLAVEANGRYYTPVLDKIRLFGGNWSVVFHKTSEQMLGPDEVLDGSRDGFHAFVDFIWAKREKRLRRLARGLDTRRFHGPEFLKARMRVIERLRFGSSTT
jgi:hypothetical protein